MYAHRYDDVIERPRIKSSNLARVLTGERLMGKNTGDGRAHPTRDEIEALAYDLYERRGRQPGRDRDDWLAAEQQLVHHYR